MITTILSILISVTGNEAAERYRAAEDKFSAIVYRHLDKASNLARERGIMKDVDAARLAKSLWQRQHLIPEGIETKDVERLRDARDQLIKELEEIQRDCVKDGADSAARAYGEAIESAKTKTQYIEDCLAVRHAVGDWKVIKTQYEATWRLFPDGTAWSIDAVYQGKPVGPVKGKWTLDKESRTIKIDWDNGVKKQMGLPINPRRQVVVNDNFITKVR